MGQGDGLDAELLRFLLALYSLILWSRDSFADPEPVFPAEQRFTATAFSHVWAPYLPVTG